MDHFEFLKAHGWYMEEFSSNFTHNIDIRFRDPLDGKFKTLKGALQSQQGRNRKGQKIVNCAKCKQVKLLNNPDYPKEKEVCLSCYTKGKNKRVCDMKRDKENEPTRNMAIIAPLSLITKLDEILEANKKFANRSHLIRFLIYKGLKAYKKEDIKNNDTN